MHLMFDFTPVFLYVYEVVTSDSSHNTLGVKFSIPSYPISNQIPSQQMGAFLKNSPLPFQEKAYDNFKYSFSFSFAKNVYDYVDFGRISGTYNPSKRIGYRGYNKGKFINNSFQWYAYYEEKNFSTGNITESDYGGNRAEQQLNKSGYIYYWLVF